jgi:hypothetical protein
MDDPGLEHFRVVAGRHTLEEPPVEVRDRLLHVFAEWSEARPPAATESPIRRFVAELVRDLGATPVVAGARGAGGTRQLLHRWPEGEVTWAVQQPAPDGLRIVGQILTAAPEARWQVSCVVDGAVAARVDADAAGEFDVALPAAATLAVHLHHDDITVECGPVQAAP